MVAWILREILSGRGRNSCRNGKIDLSCILAWDGTGLYYCQQIVSCPSRKRFVKASELVSVNLSEFILPAVLRFAASCIRLRSAEFRGGPKGPGPSPPSTLFMCLAISATRACHSIIFISEESLFVDAIKLSFIQTAVFHLYIIWYCDETTITLTAFWKSVRYLNLDFSEYKVKPWRTH